MQRSNHWFVAYDRGAELRLTTWDSKARLRSGAKHLCGQTCLHKLVDEFMVRTASTSPVDLPSQPSAKRAVPVERPVPVTNRQVIPATALVSHATAKPDRGADPLRESESSARLIGPSVPQPPVVTEMPSYHSRNWQTAAWKRERERLGACTTAESAGRSSA